MVVLLSINFCPYLGIYTGCTSVRLVLLLFPSSENKQTRSFLDILKVKELIKELFMSIKDNVSECLNFRLLCLQHFFYPLFTEG